MAHLGSDPFSSPNLSPSHPPRILPPFALTHIKIPTTLHTQNTILIYRLNFQAFPEPKRTKTLNDKNTVLIFRSKILLNFNKSAENPLFIM